MGDPDLNLNFGGRFKLLNNWSESLMYMPEIFNHDEQKDIAQSLELEFDPVNNDVFYFSTTEALFRCDRRETTVPVKLNTEGLGSPSALSMSDSQYLLVGFTCGSIAIYHNSYTNPITVWYNTSKYPIVKINWCLLFFSDDPGTVKSDRRYMNRLCEFFAIDKSEQFMIWNLSKDMNKPAHSIKFADKHESLMDDSLYRISMTAAD